MRIKLLIIRSFENRFTKILITNDSIHYYDENIDKKIPPFSKTGFKQLNNLINSKTFKEVKPKNGMITARLDGSNYELEINNKKYENIKGYGYKYGYWNKFLKIIFNHLKLYIDSLNDTANNDTWNLDFKYTHCNEDDLSLDDRATIEVFGSLLINVILKKNSVVNEILEFTNKQNISLDNIEHLRSISYNIFRNNTLNRENFIQYILDKFPDFKIFWFKYSKNYGADKRAFGYDLVAVGDFAVDLIKNNEEDKVRLLLSIIEDGIQRGDDIVQYGIKNCFLDNILSKSIMEQEFDSKIFIRNLRSESKKYYKTWKSAFKKNRKNF